MKATDFMIRQACDAYDLHREEGKRAEWFGMEAAIQAALDVMPEAILSQRDQGGVREDDARDAARYQWLVKHADISMDMGALRMVVTCSEESHGAKGLLDAAIDHMLSAAPRPGDEEKGK